MGVLAIWDIHVFGTNNYFAGGVLHHNSGKSYCAAFLSALMIRDVLTKDSIVWSVSPNSELSVKTPQRYLWELLPHPKINKAYNPQTGFGTQNPLFIYDERTKDNPNGRNIIVYFKTQAQYENDPDSFESATVNGFVWVDESIDEKTWNAIQPRIAVHNCPVIVSTIPRMDWMYEAFEEPPEGAKVYFDKLLPQDNPVMTEDGVRRLASGIQSEEERQMRLFGNFMFFGGIVYKEFKKEYKPNGHLISPFPIPEDWPRVRYMDLGMDHPTAVLWGAMAPNGNLYIYREYYSRHKPLMEDAEEIKRRSVGEKFTLPLKVPPDAYQMRKGQDRTIAQQLERYGLPVSMSVRVGNNGIREWPLIQDVKELLLNNKLFVFDTCENLIREFRKWKFKRNQHGEPVGDSFVDRDNDGLDCLKYMVADLSIIRGIRCSSESTIND